MALASWLESKYTLLQDSEIYLRVKFVFIFEKQKYDTCGCVLASVELEALVYHCCGRVEVYSIILGPSNRLVG